MNIQELLKDGSTVLLIVTPAMLKDFALSVAEEVTQKSEEPIYTTAEFAKRKKVDRSTLYRWVKAGFLKQYKVGGKIYYRDCDLQEGISMFERPASVPKQTATTTESANENMSEEYVIDFPWEIPDENVLPFSPMKEIAYTELLIVLRGIFPQDMSVEYLLWCIQRAQYGEMLRYAKLYNRAGDFKRAVNEIIKGYFPNNDDYLKAAYKSMGIESDDKYLLSRYNVSKDGKDMLKRLQNVVKS